MNHSRSLYEIPSGPPQEHLFSLAVALLSSAIHMGAERASLCLVSNLGSLLKKSL